MRPAIREALRGALPDVAPERVSTRRGRVRVIR
jgi:hypothetical protein